MAIFIIGASGSGKTACLEKLNELLPDYKIHDFDDIGVPDSADKKWRQQATEKWLQKIIGWKEEKKFCLLGQIVPGEILACPSAPKLLSINICLLDCDDYTRIDRLKKRNVYAANQDTLNWAAWLRMHCHNPQWEQRVIKDDSWQGMQFNRWDSLTSWDKLAKIELIDTSRMSLLQVCHQIADHVSKHG